MGAEQQHRGRERTPAQEDDGAQTSPERGADAPRLQLSRAPAPPRFFVHNARLDEKLRRLTGGPGLVRVAAPLGSGKRTGLAAWLERPNPRIAQVHWLRRTESLATHESLADDVAELLARVPLLTDGGAPGEHRRTSTGAGARRPSPTAAGPQGGEPVTVVVLDLGPAPASVAQIESLATLVARLTAVCLIVVSDDDQAEPWGAGRARDVTAQDLRLDPDAVAPVFRSYGFGAHFDAFVRADPAAAADPELMSALFAEATETGRMRVGELDERVRARRLYELLARALPSSGIRLAALFGLVEELPEATVHRLLRAPQERARLRALAARGLLLRSEGERGASYRLPPRLAEPLRALAAAPYAADPAGLHRLAAEAFDAAGDLAAAIRHLLLGGDEPAAVALFAARWEMYAIDEGVRRARVLTMALPSEEVFQDPEAIAAVWLVHAISPGVVPAALYQTSLLQLSPAAFARMSERGELTVRTARALLLLRTGSVEAAAVEVERGADAARRIAETGRGETARLHAAYQLVAARVALWRGDLATATRRFMEISELLSGDRLSELSFFALQGRSLALALNGAFAQAERVRQQAAELLAELELEDSRFAAELYYCEAWLRDNEVSAHGLLRLRHLVGAQHGDGLWAQVSGYIDALLYLRDGNWERAAATIRSLLSTLRPTRQELPLLAPQLQALLAVCLVALGRPGDALLLVADRPDGIAHMPCFSTVRAVALVAQGDAAGALAVTERCVSMPDHARPYLAYTHAARALAQRALGLEESARQSYRATLGAVVGYGIRADLRVLLNGRLEELDRRIGAESPELSAEAHRLMVPVDRAEAAASIMPGFADLTAREWETLQLLAGTQPLAEIAASVAVNRNTLKSRTRALYRKLGVSSRQEAVALAVQQGVLRA
ncbi:MAG TPA: LuxR C-terminal-related transcriptional regulator [Gryllotalpicola sp.]